MSVAGIAARMRGAVAFLGSTPEERAVSYDQWLAGLAPVSYTGKTVTPTTAVQMSAVWACVSLIADSYASSTPETFTKNADGLLVKNPNPDWVDAPSTDLLPYEFRFASAVSTLIDGNTFYYVVRDRLGQPVELILLDPTVVDVELDPTYGRRTYRVNGEAVQRHEILHVPGFLPPGAARAIAPITAAQQAIGLGMAAEEFGARFFANGTTMSGVIEVPGGLDDDQAKVMAQSFATNHQGVRKSHLPGVLTGGATWKGLSVPPEQAQFLETRKFQVTEIARIYRVPPHLVGDVERSTSWGSGIEEQNRNFIQYTLSPWTMRFEAAMSSLLPEPQVVKFNMNDLLRGTKKERYETYSIGVDGGFLTPDEARAEEGLPPLPEGAGSKPRLAPNDSPFSSEQNDPAQEPVTNGGSDESE